MVYVVLVPFQLYHVLVAPLVVMFSNIVLLLWIDPFRGVFMVMLGAIVSIVNDVCVVFRLFAESFA